MTVVPEESEATACDRHREDREFANAGHEPPLLRKRDRSYQTFHAEAPPLGILPDMECWTTEVELDGGEFDIFSDGLTEVRYGDEEELGVDGCTNQGRFPFENPLHAGAFDRWTGCGGTDTVLVVVEAYRPDKPYVAFLEVLIASPEDLAALETSLDSFDVLRQS